MQEVIWGDKMDEFLRVVINEKLKEGWTIIPNATIVFDGKIGIVIGKEEGGKAE